MTEKIPKYVAIVPVKPQPEGLIKYLRMAVKVHWLYDEDDIRGIEVPEELFSELKNEEQYREIKNIIDKSLWKDDTLGMNVIRIIMYTLNSFKVLGLTVETQQAIHMQRCWNNEKEITKQMNGKEPEAAPVIAVRSKDGEFRRFNLA